ncbi:multidrug efflux RND transporter permease subunit [Stieleria sp. TO1_6]|uniref:efflux RND transporter permease subunit n=1 Tax=Stieleria tagensis TaxID=2956795 RepID=UPI00209B8696|nr:multidrug efflux RND transporter permease subunit [Stieleria tagensis]MCO8124188.1 multidrug efflux RND transporter permease subunit [Stieleria tagensis]
MTNLLFVRRPRFAFVISLVITLMGLLAMGVIPIDQYPDITPPKVTVRALYPGATAETLNDTVASPIENEVNGAEGMVYMDSKSSSDGVYLLTVTFDISRDSELAQVDVQNRVQLALPELPEDVRKRGVVVKKQSPDLLMVANLFSPDNRFDEIFLSNYATLQLEGELSRVPGVGDARVLGALDYGMRVWLDPLKLKSHHVSVADVIGAVEEQNLQAAVGQLGGPPNPDSTQFQYALTTKGRLDSPEEFGDIVIRADSAGAVTRLRDVARIELGAESYKGFGEFNNQPGVLLGVFKLAEANAVDVAAAVRARIAELEKYFPDGLEYTIGHDTTLFIKESLRETVLTLLFTIALVIVVTYLFLGSVRATVIPAIAVPVSLIGTVAVLYAFGMSINTITLFALLLAIAIVVDDAIIVVENVERLIEENQLDAKEATRRAMKEVSAPIIATSLVLAAVFVPTMFLPGITGQMFKQFGVTIVVSVIISMINAMTLSPALASIILKPGSHRKNLLVRGFDAVFAKITQGYLATVTCMTNHLVVSSALVCGLFALLYGLASLTPASFLPDEDKGFFLVDVQLPPAASLNRTTLVMDEITETLKKDPHIENVLSVNGVSAVNHAMQPNTGLVIVKLKPWSERTTPDATQAFLQNKYQHLFNKIPACRTLVFGAPAIPGMGVIAGNAFVIEDTTSQGAEKLGETMNQMIAESTARPEISQILSTFQSATPQIALEIDRIKAKTLGVAISDVFTVLQTQLGGYYVNDFNLYNMSYHVMLQADSQFRQTEQDLSSLYVQNNLGNQVPLSVFVTAKPSFGPDILYKYNTYDSVTITGVTNAADGYSSGDAMDAMQQVADSNLPDGYKYEWTGQSYEERKSGNMAPIAFALSLVFSFLFLAALYESFVTPIAILLSIPVAMFGAFLALTLSGQALSLYGQIGLVLLVGLSAKTAILIVEFGKMLRERDQLDLQAATVKAARLRFRPVMMTSIAFIVGVFPLVTATGAGAGGRVSLGLVIFGGTLMLALVGTLLIPIFFRLVQSLREAIHRGPTTAP